MLARRIPFRVLTFLLAIAITLLSAGAASLAIVDTDPIAAGGRKVLVGVPVDLIPARSNVWKCACDSDGCWPGCFTLASASLLKYWSQKAYPNLWSYRGAEDENNGLLRLRELFPNLLCFGNGNANGRPGDSGYDAHDVANGLRLWFAERGYRFTVTAIAAPTFEQIVTEIDAGRPMIGAFGQSPWGSHAGTLIGYDTTRGRRAIIVRPNLQDAADAELEWGVGYQEFGIVTVAPGGRQGVTAAPPQLVYDLVVGTRDPGFSAAGDWDEPGGLGLGGAALRTRTVLGEGPSEQTAFARWSPAIPYDGMWEVQAWMPLDAPDARTSAGTVYNVSHAEGQSLVRRSQRDASQGWMSLGAFPFVRGSRGFVTLGNATPGTAEQWIWSDAVRFVWRAPLLARSEDDSPALFLVRDGRRRLMPQDGGLTMGALRMLPSQVRTLTPLQLAQYATGESIPSVLSSWVGEYFNNTQLAPPSAAIRNDGRLALRWDGASPVAGVSALGFSGRWTRVMAFSQGEYQFKIQAAGGLRFWVDGRLEIDQWEAGDAFVEREARTALDGGLHRLEIEYVNRTGGAALVFANLPPNPPLPVDPPAVRYSPSLTTTLQWIDTGDADGAIGDGPRRFRVSVRRDTGGAGEIPELFSSGWITSTQWLAPFPASGGYVWQVAASDGTTVSGWSAPRKIVVDRAPPWAQMISATNAGEEAASGLPGRNPGLRLRWLMTDALSGVAYVEVQAREIVKADLSVQNTVSYRPQPSLGVEVRVENGREVTRTTVITSLVPVTGVATLRALSPDPSADWKLVFSREAGEEAVFVGNPGSVYEFRARATDRAGNTQAWFDGYSITAQMDAYAPPPPAPTPTQPPTPLPPSATATPKLRTPTALPTPAITPAPTATDRQTAGATPTPSGNVTDDPRGAPNPIPSANPTPIAMRARVDEGLDSQRQLAPLPVPAPAQPVRENSAYLRLDVLSAAASEGPIPPPDDCAWPGSHSGPANAAETAYDGLRSTFSLRLSNYAPIDIRGWRLAAYTSEGAARACIVGRSAQDRLPAVPAGARQDFIVVAYSEPSNPIIRLEAQWQGERYVVCAAGGLLPDCRPLQGLRPTERATVSPTGLSRLVPTSTPALAPATVKAVPTPTATPRVDPAKWAARAQAFDVSTWGRPAAGSCFGYDDGDPVLRWQADVRLENLSPSAIADLRVTLFEGTKPLLTCFHGYGGVLPKIPAGDGRNITFFSFVDKGSQITSMVIEAAGQAQRLCVAGRALIPCR